MTAATLISTIIQPLTLEDTGNFAIDQMSEFHVRHIPLIEGDQLLGLVSEDDILNFDLDKSIGSLGLRFNRPYVSAKNHIYEILRLMADSRLTVIPVVDREGKYIGMITQEDILAQMGNMGSFTVPGSIIVLEMNRKDYSLAKISSIIEQENAAVLSTFITSDLKSSLAEVTIKINKKDVSRIVASLQRFDFEVKASFHESEYLNDSMKERYESLMMYLNV